MGGVGRVGDVCLPAGFEVYRLAAARSLPPAFGTGDYDSPAEGVTFPELNTLFLGLCTRTFEGDAPGDDEYVISADERRSAVQNAPGSSAARN